MRLSAMIRAAGVVLWAGCATTGAPAKDLAPSLGPVFEQVTVPAGVDGAAFEAVVRAHLPELAACVALSAREAGKFIPLAHPELLDDRVELSSNFRATLPEEIVEPRRDAYESSIVGTFRGPLTDSGCLSRLLLTWPFPPALMQALAARDAEHEPGFTLSYRYRPSAEARKARQATATRDVAAFCTLFEGVKPGEDLTPRYMEGRNRLSAELRWYGDDVFRLAFPFPPAQRADLVVPMLQDLGPAFGVESCAAFHGLIRDE